MLPAKQITGISKFMSLVLRHQPETIGLILDENGWASTEELIDKMANHGNTINFAILEQVVATNAKKRFAFNDDKTKIRANQGHSIEVDLQLEAIKPPVQLYHGTGEQSVASILTHGLEKRSRQHVHLSSDRETAVAVGNRHGKPVVLVVNAAAMDADGFQFFLSDNKVWLTEHVPAKYVAVL